MTDTKNQSQDPLWSNLQQYASGAPEEVANTAKSLVPEQPQDTLATRSARGEISPGQAIRQTVQQTLSPQSIQQVAENTANIATPVGNINSAIDAGKAYNRGDWLGTALGAIGSIPMVGGIFLPAREAQIAKALQMEQAGAHAHDIWREANVYKGPEGNWWREISDLPSKPTDAAKTFLETNTSAAGKAPQIYSHPELYKEVPQVKDYDLSYFKTKPRLTASDPKYSIAAEQKAAEMEAQGVNPTEIYRRTGASRNPQGEWTQYNDPEGLHYGSEKAIEVHAPNMNDFRSTNIHEFQHAADKAHGFTSGASPEELYWDVAQRPLEDVVKQAQASRAAGSKFAPDVENYTQDPDKLLQKFSNDLYWRDSSEVRARAAQARRNMTDEQRAAKIPTASMDVPLEQQIVRGKQAAADNPSRLIAGINAQTANHEALAIAKDLQSAGHSPEAIYNKTRWWQGEDGKWRFEIPDDQSQMYALKYGEQPLNEALHHQKLYEAYPDIASRPTHVGRFETETGEPLPHMAAGYDPDLDTFNLNSAHPINKHSPLLHEVQHAIQNREGFSPGANTRRFTPEEIAAERRAGGWGRATDEQIARDMYTKAPGEREAREVQERMRLTPDERTDKPPYDVRKSKPRPALTNFNGLSDDTFDFLNARKYGGSISDATRGLLYKLKMGSH